MKPVKKNLTPQKAYALVEKKAKKMDMTVSGYAEFCGVGRHVPSKWRNKKEGTVMLEFAAKLRII